MEHSKQDLLAKLAQRDSQVNVTQVFNLKLSSEVSRELDLLSEKHFADPDLSFHSTLQRYVFCFPLGFSQPSRVREARADAGYLRPQTAQDLHLRRSTLSQTFNSLSHTSSFGISLKRVSVDV